MTDLLIRSIYEGDRKVYELYGLSGTTSKYVPLSNVIRFGVELCNIAKFRRDLFEWLVSTKLFFEFRDEAMIIRTDEKTVIVSLLNNAQVEVNDEFFRVMLTSLV